MHVQVPLVASSVFLVGVTVMEVLYGEILASKCSEERRARKNINKKSKHKLTKGILPKKYHSFDN